MNTAEKLRSLVLQNVRPEVIAAVRDSALFGRHDSPERSILLAEGLARQNEGYDWLSWTPEGQFLSDVLEASVKAYAEAVSSPEVVTEPEGPKSLTSNEALAKVANSIRKEAQARGGLR